MIYKFFSNTDFILSTLINGQLWFSMVEDFNDPFEWHFPYRISLKRDKADIEKYVEDTNYGRSQREKTIILKQYIENPEILETELNKSLHYRKNKGVCCFTNKENILNVIMWAHYAKSHSGIVLGFSEDVIQIVHLDDWRLNKNSNTIFFNPDLRKVTYKNTSSFVNPFEKERPNVRDFEYIKAKDWEYEKEIRIVSPKYGLHSFNKQSLKEIYFGINTKDYLKQSIVNIINSSNDYTSVKLFDCIRDKKKLEMKLNKYKYVC